VLVHDTEVKPPEGLEAHLAAVKTDMKPRPKNELIKIIGALLVDNYLLKQALETSRPLQKPVIKSAKKLGSFLLGLAIGAAIVASTAKAEDMPIKLTKSNTVIWFGEINDRNAQAVVKGLIALRKTGKEPIYLVFASGGGLYSTSMLFSNVSSGDKNLHSVIIFAASGAAAISQAVGGNAYIVPKGQLMFHEVKTYWGGQGIDMDLAKEVAKDLEDANIKFSEVCNRRMKLPDYPERVKSDWWLNATEAKKLGAAKIQSFRCAKEVRDADIRVPTFGYITGQVSLKNFCDLIW